jgi:hypothetical protein
MPTYRIANPLDKTNILFRYQEPIYMTGMILIWSGTVATIPDGWHLCDGTEGTPDLRNKFIVGAGDSYDPGESFTSTIEPNAFMTAYALCYIQKL